MYTLFDNNKDFVLGHRGYSEKYPENTMLSFSKCLEDSRINGIELDVHLCRSGELVVAHDGNLKRVAGIDRYIEDMTWDELKDIDVGSFKDPSFSSCRMPQLKDLFESFGTRFVYDVELKVEPGRKYKKLCQQVWDTICEYNMQEVVMVSSFHPLALRCFNRCCAMSIPTADIYDETCNPKFLRKGKGHILSDSSYTKPHYTIAGESYIEKLGMEMIPWTVNDEQSAQVLLKNPKVKGLIGNNPVLLAEIREKVRKN